MQKLLFVDFIRVISTLLIICCHYTVSFTQYSIDGGGNYLLNFANTDSGKLGVYLFFMISGFGLAYKYIHNEFSFASYYKSRFIKIFPLLWVSWLFFYIVKLITSHNIINMGFIPLIWTLLGMDYYVGGMTPTYALVGEWFTGAIILLYLIFPMLLYLFKNNKTFLISSVFFYALWLVNTYVYPLPHTTNVESIFADLFYFWIGMFIAKWHETIKKYPIAVILLFLVPILIVPNNFHVLFNSLLASVLIFLLCMKFDYTKINKNFIYKFILEYSYAIYLVHHMTIYFFMEKFQNSHLSFLQGLLLLVPIFLAICCIAFIVTKATNIIITIFKNKLKLKTPTAL